MKKVLENKKVMKSLRKLDINIQKKYSKMVKELNQGGIRSLSFEAKKMEYNKDIVRVKLDYRHRAALLINQGVIEVIEVATRENFNYIGSC